MGKRRADAGTAASGLVHLEEHDLDELSGGLTGSSAGDRAQKVRPDAGVTALTEPFVYTKFRHG